MALYRDRAHAGRVTASKLVRYAGKDDVVVLALPRGGVPVAYEIARALKAPLDVYVIRKLGVPGHEELAMGAIATGGVRIINDALVRRVGLDAERLAEVEAHERLELARREALYRRGRPPLDVQGRTAILVDDGLATGATMIAAIAALRSAGPREIVVAVPVGSRDTCERIAPLVDDIVCAAMPEPFVAVGPWYEDFSQTEDAEVLALLGQPPIAPSRQAET